MPKEASEVFSPRFALLFFSILFGDEANVMERCIWARFLCFDS